VYEKITGKLWKDRGMTQTAARVAKYFCLIHPDWVDSEETIIASFQTWMSPLDFATCCIRLEVIFDFLENSTGNVKGAIAAFQTFVQQISVNSKAILVDVAIFWHMAAAWHKIMPNQKRIVDSPLDTQPYKRIKSSAFGPQGSLLASLVPTPAITPSTIQTTDSESDMVPINLFQRASPMVSTQKSKKVKAKTHTKKAKEIAEVGLQRAPNNKQVKTWCEENREVFENSRDRVKCFFKLEEEVQKLVEDKWEEQPLDREANVSGSELFRLDCPHSSFCSLEP
jgi:hypothetical protein